MAASLRFATLDGMRGLAAILVMLFHAGLSAPVVVARGYLAVDLFFGLSGFVLAAAYERRLSQGLGLAEFAAARLTRIYPMVVVGGLFAAVFDGGSLARMLLLPGITPDGFLYSGNTPLWSLLFELIVNLSWAAVALRCGWRGLIAVLAVSGALLIWGAVRAGDLDIGVYWRDLPFGLARTVFSFTLGVAMARLHALREPERRQTPWALLLFPALACLLMAPVKNTVLWDLASALALLPALLWVGTVCEAPGGALLARLGNLSFPLYCIHMPVVNRLKESGPVAMGAGCLALIAAALFLDHYWDRPVRARLTAVLRANRPAGALPA